MFSIYRKIKRNKYMKKKDKKNLNIPTIYLNKEFNKKNEYKYSTNDIKRIKNLKIDYFLNTENNFINKEIISCSEFGLLKIYFSYDQNIREKISTFWSIKNKRSKSYFIISLKKINSSKDQILFIGHISTQILYSLNLQKLESKAYGFLKILLEKWTNYDLNKITIKSVSKIREIKKPNLFIFIFYILDSLKIILKRKEKWAVGYYFDTNWLGLDIKKFKIIKNPQNRWLADPFVLYRNGSHYCFAEDFNYKEKKGSISVFEINKNNTQEIGIALAEQFHLSYPFIFEAYGNLYMCPATPDINQIRLYKCIDFPLKWNLDKILIDNIRAVDTNIFFHDNNWWILTNLSSANFGDNDSELHVFYNPNLFSNKWQKHPSNPVIFDSNYARNGGLILDQKKTYRIFQKQRFNDYGYSSGISEIIKLSKTEYKEKIIFENKDHLQIYRGTHTFNYHKNLSVLDVKIK